MDSLITSRKNPAIARLRQLLRKGSERRKEGVLILEGPKLAVEYLRTGKTPRAVYMSSSFAEDERTEELRGALEGTGAPPYFLADEALAWASTLDSNQGIILEVDALHSRQDLPKPPGLIVVAWGLQDPGNLGSLARVVEGAGASGLICTTAGADPGNPKALRASAGSLLRIPVVRMEADEILPLLGESGWKVAAADSVGESAYTEVDWTESWALILGEEGRGIPDEVMEAAGIQVAIPLHQVESLNVSTSAAVLLFEAARQRNR